MDKSIETIILCAAVAAVMSCYAKELDEVPASLFPAPFGNVRLGMSESAFRNLCPDAVLEKKNEDGSSWLYVNDTNLFEEAGFYFVSTDGNSKRKLEYAMLSYLSETPFRDVLAEAENRLGVPPAVQTTLFGDDFCFERTWRFSQGEATLLFWPRSFNTHLQWRIAKTGPTSVHDGFLPALPNDINAGAWAGFYTMRDEKPSYHPADYLSMDATRRLFGALDGWETFDPVDLETQMFADGTGISYSGHWIVEDGSESFSRWFLHPDVRMSYSASLAVAADGAWIANLGTNGIARSIPESRRPVVLAALATVTNEIPEMAELTANGDELAAACVKEAEALFFGRGVPKNETKAIAWASLLAARRNVPSAWTLLGTMAHSISLQNEDKPTSMATESLIDSMKEFYRMAGENGDPLGMSTYAILLANGDFGEPDEKRAHLLVQAAVAAEQDLQSVVANGPDLDEIAKLTRNKVSELKGKAEGGDADAMREWARVLYSGRKGVAQDKAAAVEWYRKAIEAGNEEAMRALGSVLFWNPQFELESGEAVQWLIKGGLIKSDEVDDVSNLDALRNNPVFRMASNECTPVERLRILGWLKDGSDFAPSEAIELLDEEYDRPKSGVGKNGPCVALPLPALEADFCTRQITRGLPDNIDPIITLSPGIYLYPCGEFVKADFIFNATDIAKDEGFDAGENTEIDLVVGYDHSFDKTTDWDVVFSFDYTCEFDRSGNGDGGHANYIHASAALDDAFLSPEISGEWMLDGIHGQYYTLGFSHKFKFDDTLSLSLSFVEGLANDKYNAEDLGCDSWGLRETTLLAELEWTMAGGLLTIKPYIAYGDHLNSHFRHAARYYADEEAEHHVAQFYCGIAVKFPAF